MLRKNKLFIALCLNLFFLSIYFAFGQIRHGSLDDYFMSSVLTGAYGSKYDAHLYFVNSAYGYFLKPFYFLFPQIGWYFIFELLGTFAAFVIFSYCIIQRLGTKWGFALTALVLATLTPDFYFQLSFTQCATIYTAAGLLLLFAGMSDNNIRYIILGGLFFLAGSIMRFEGFLLGIPYLALFLFYGIIRKKFFKKNLIALFLIATAIWGIQINDKSLYSNNDYRYYADYQPIRSYFADGAFYDRESTCDELEERDMSCLDFNLLKSWMFYDTDVFCKDSLESIKQIAQNNLYKPNPPKFIVSFFMAVSRMLTKPAGWGWFILCFLLTFSKSKEANVYPWLSFCIIALSIGYLLWVNRLVYHVETGIWLYAITSSIFLLDTTFTKFSFFAKWKNIAWFGTVFIAIIFTTIGISNQAYLKKELKLIHTIETPSDWALFLNHVKDNPQKAFLLSFDRYKELGELRNPPYRAIEPGSFNNIFPWGYWNIYLPAMKQELVNRGITNPIRDIIHENVYLLEDNNGPSLGLFYKKHHHHSIKADTVEKFGNLYLLKYHLYDSLENSIHE